MRKPPWHKWSKRTRRRVCMALLVSSITWMIWQVQLALAAWLIGAEEITGTAPRYVPVILALAAAWLLCGGAVADWKSRHKG